MLHEAGFAPQDICRVTGHRNAESLKHYIDAASTRKTVEAADVLEDLVNPENSVERHNSDLVATQAASSSVPAASSSGSSVQNFSFDLNSLPMALLGGATLQGCTINFNINVSK